MHIGRTEGRDRARPFARLSDGREDGAISADGRVAGTYLHGLFAGDAFRHGFLATLAPRQEYGIAFEHEIEDTLDLLADHLTRHIDLDRVLEIAHGR